MHKRRSRIEQCFCFLWLLSIVYFIEVPVISSSILTELIWIPGIIYLAIISLSAMQHSNKNEAAYVAICFIVLLLGMVSGGVLFSVKHLIATTCYMTQILSMIVVSKSTVSKRTFDFIFYSAVVISLIFTVLSFTPLAYLTKSTGIARYTVYFVFNLDYSNLAGIYLFCIFSILLVNLKYRKHKLFIIILMAYVGWMIYKTNARSCIISVLAIIAIDLFYRNKKIPKFVVIGGLIFPVLFAVVYSYLSINGYSNFQFLGKNLFTGRQEVYANYLSRIHGLEGYLIGNFAENALQNAHNGPISVFSSMGIIGIYATYRLYYRTINTVNHGLGTISTTCVACVLGIMILTSAEATMMLGGFPAIVFFDTLFLLANYEGNPQLDE